MEYILYQFVPSLALGLATWLAVWIIYPPKVKELPMELAVEEMPPMEKKEKQLAWIPCRYLCALVFNRHY